MKQRHLYLGVILLMLVQGAQAQPATPDSTGYLRLVVHLDSVFVYFNDDYHNYQRIDSVAVLELPAREHKITLASARAYDYEFYQAITPGDTATYSVRLSTRINPKAFYRYSSYPVLRTNATLMVFTDEDSEIFIDGQAAGRGMVKKDLEPGAYTVETRHPRAGDKKQQVHIVANRPRLVIVELYNRPTKGQSRALGIVPGASQFYKRQAIKGVLFLGVIAGGAAAAYLKHQSFVDENDRYEVMLSRYQSAFSEEDALRFGDEAEAQYDLTIKEADARDVLIGAAVGLYLLNMIDAWIAPGSGFRSKPSGIDYFVTPVTTPTGSGVRLALRF